MKQHIRLLACILSLTFVIPLLFSACGGDPKPSTEFTTTATTALEEKIPVGVWVEKDDQWGYLELGGDMLIDFSSKFERTSFNAYGIAAMKEGDSYYYYNTFGEKISEYEGTYQAGTANLYVVKKDGKAGMVDHSGTLVIDFIFDNIGTPNPDGLTRAYLNGKSGYIDLSGEWVIEPQFNGVGDFAFGLAAAKQGEKWGIINEQGAWITQPKYDEIVKISEGGIAIVKLNEKIGYVSASGEEIFAPQFDGAKPFVGDYATVKSGDRYGAVTKTGSWFLNPIYHDVLLFPNGAYMYMTDHWYYVSADGKTTQDLGDGIVNHSNGDDYIIFFHQSKYGCFNCNGQWVIPQEYSGMDLADLSKGWLPAAKDGKWGYLDTDGKWCLTPEYDRTYAFHEVDGWGKLAKVQVGKKYGLINESGEWIVPPDYDAIYF